jgi:hypothetical protein
VRVARTVAIVQSSYIPWKGYFDLIRRADHFILYDDAQFTRRDWRSRNRIKTKDGLQWLSIPVDVRGRRAQRVRDVRIADASWAPRHWKRVAAAYACAPHFAAYRDAVEEVYGRATSPWLSEINRQFIETICACLGFAPSLSWSSDYSLPDGTSERLLDMCRQAGGGVYLSGPRARAYLDMTLFASAGVSVQFIDYDYPEYPQVHPPFEHTVSALDLIFNAGPEAQKYLLPL